MKECFTDPIFGNFRVERKRVVKCGGSEEEREGLEGKVSYSVSGDLQITLKYHMISLKLDFK